MLGQSEKCTYLRVSEGKLRIKCDEGTPGAVARVTEKDGVKKVVFENVYTFCEGKIVNIVERVHPEYGTSYNLVLQDGQEKYSIQMGEKSSYFSSLVMLLPSIDFSLPVKVKPYSIKNDNGFDNQGFVIYQNEVKVENHYKQYDETTKKSTPKNGLEQFDYKSVKKDKKGNYIKTEMDILRLRVLQFLKEEMDIQIARIKESTPVHNGDAAAPADNGDLPF